MLQYKMFQNELYNTESLYRFIQRTCNCNDEAEWIPFQTQYFSENLVVPEIEPEPLDL
jgi:hypothetical protein